MNRNLHRIPLPALACLAILALAPRTAAAAESYACTGFITSVPTVISTQGTWCMDKDLAMAQNNAKAIEITTNNVTIDCNDFKLGGLSAGSATQSTGIYANNRLNATVRNCNVRGFYYGIFLTGAGHLVTDNRLDGNTYYGISVTGDGSVIRRNRVVDTGGSTVQFSGGATGISSSGSTEISDNIVDTVEATPTALGFAYGISTANNTSGSIFGNRVRGVVADGPGAEAGIINGSSGRVVIRNNDVVDAAGAGNVGISCANASGRALGNVVLGFSSQLQGCSNDGGNVLAP